MSSTSTTLARQAVRNPGDLTDAKNLNDFVGNINQALFNLGKRTTLNLEQINPTLGDGWTTILDDGTNQIKFQDSGGLFVVNLNGVSSSFLTVNAATSVTLLNYTLAVDTSTTVSATTWTTLVANQSFSVTNANAPIEVLLQGMILQYLDTISTGTQLAGVVRIQVDGTTNYIVGSSVVVAAVTNDAQNPISPSSINLGILSAGVHTINVQVWSNLALNTGSAGFYLNVVSQAPIQFLQFQVVQRG